MTKGCDTLVCGIHIMFLERRWLKRTSINCIAEFKRRSKGRMLE